MYDSDDPEDRTFPIWLVAIAFLAVIGTMVVFSSGKPLDPPELRGPLLGCYMTANGPDLLFDRSSVTVLQEPRIKVRSELKYIKGWAFDVDKALNFHRMSGGKAVINLGSKGEYLYIVREGQFASKVPGFNLIDGETLLAIRYTRSGDNCSSVPMTEESR